MAAEARLTEIAVLKTHSINYAKTREVYTAYRKAGYSKAFLEAHREEIALHKAAKAAFDEAGLQKLPKVKALDAKFAELLTKKKATYPEYRKARNEMQELVRARKTWNDFLRRKKIPPKKRRPDKRIPPRSFPSWEASSADFLVYIAALQSNAPVTRIFSPRSFLVLQQAGACTKGSGIYTVPRQHKRLPGSFSPQFRRCTVQCVPGPCRFARHAPSD